MNAPIEWAIGWKPSIAKPAATPTIACSAMPRFTARSGWRSIAREK